MKKTRLFLSALTTLLVVAWLALPVQTQIQPYNYWVPPSSCTTVVSGNSTGTNGQTVSGTSNHVVVQAQTSVTGTNTHTYICNLTPPAALGITGSRVRVVDVVFVYGQPTAELSSTQASVLASGTFNGTTVFTYVNYPTPGASETTSTEAPVRADSGSLVITPVTASFNTSTTTAGRFYTATFKPATPISWNIDLRQLIFSVTLKLNPSVAITTNSPGLLVHITSQ